MSKLFIFSHDKVINNGIASGPGIRFWGIARALRDKGHKITIVEKKGSVDATIEGIVVQKYRPSFLKDITSYDAGIISIWVDDAHMLEKMQSVPLIVDAYAPIIVEHSYSGYDLKDEKSFWHFTNDVWQSSLLPLRYGDCFLCASDAQKHYLLGLLSALGRINPYSKDLDLVKIVPFGMEKEKPAYKGPVLRKRIQQDQRIILWLSSFFPWLDPVYAAKIMTELALRGEKYALAVVGAKNPNVSSLLYDENYRRFMDYVKKNDMLDKSVFIFDWLGREDLASALSEADLGILTGRNTYEEKLSFRARAYDLLWGRLPLLTTGMDIVSRSVADNKMGMHLDSKSPKKAAESVAKLNAKEIALMKKNIESFIEKSGWDDAILPIEEYLKEPFRDTAKSKLSPQHLEGYRKEYNSLLLKENEEKDALIGNLRQDISNLIKRHAQDTQLLEKLFDSRDQEINELRKNNRDLESHKSALEKEGLSLRNELEYLKNELHDRNQDISELSEKISVLEQQNSALKSMSEKISVLVQQNSAFSERVLALEQQNSALKSMAGRFRSSVVYPLFRMTSSLGNTGAGKVLQKLLK